MAVVGYRSYNSIIIAHQNCASILVNLMQNYWSAVCLLTGIILVESSQASPDAKRLYDDLMSDYNRAVRPVVNNTDTITVKFGLKLTQIIDLFAITYYIFNINADGHYVITIMTKAIVHHDGLNQTVSPSNTQGSEISKSLSPLVLDGVEKPMPVASSVTERRLSAGLTSDEEFPPPPPPEKLEILSGIGAQMIPSSSEIDYSEQNDPNLLSCKVFMDDSQQYAYDPNVVEASIPEPIVTSNKKWCQEFGRALIGIRFIAHHMENLDSFYEVR
ncbi:nicotinic acetylcholine receptor alpha2 subunit-like protein [Dinothrombium tinctorium]|uniref:Nicotinic acetylcholine receptor alpha2 subunit-like protein n=1 Tax=Dinothrombium tinctorium TaxID=1965070 RepID=A0A443RRY3_9ACAR|nr:nicotinic acetylcholine receptor alpha2 subunit-like protein [Dinothrombium tinctorium]